MEYKRKQRGLSDLTKQRISAKLKGKRKSISHAANISKGLQNYWAQIPQVSSGSTNQGGWM
jgi:hypothetical protein